MLAYDTSISQQTLNLFRIGVNFFFIFYSFIFAGGVWNQTPVLVNNRDLLFTTVSPVSVVVADVTAGFLRSLVFLPVLFFIALGFGLGIGSPIVGQVAVLFFAPLLALLITFGYTVGTVFLLLTLQERVLKQPRSLDREKRGVINFFVAAFFLVPILFLYLPVKSPITIYADAFFFATPLGSPDFGTLVAVVGVVAGIPLSVFASTRLAPLVLPFESGDDENVVEKPSQDTFENKDAENSLEALSTRTAGRNQDRLCSIYQCSHSYSWILPPVSGVTRSCPRKRLVAPYSQYILHRLVRTRPSRR